MKKAVLVLMMLGFMSGGSYAAEVYGKWATQDKKGEIDIVKCGTAICGLIAKEAKPGAVDDKNEDPKLRGQPMLGLQLFKLEITGDPKKWEGDLYNPRDGKTYKGVVNLLNDDEVKLEGCFLFFCQGQVWSRI
ncbi:MAG: hypothetical protein COB24_09845 [Hyphomicrobiales bacterium]|nr:MAG: hypothetical protein COB24_09845 [Hyphomicrobiales bacterium]